MDPHTLLILGGIIGLLVLSAFFSGSETSLTAASRARMHTLAQQGDRRAAQVNRLWETKERMIGTILLGNNLVNILASALATSLMISWFGDAGVAYATLAMTLLVLIFAEVLPKTYALYNADRMALAVAAPCACSACAPRRPTARKAGKRSCAAPSSCTKARTRKSATSARCCARSSTSAMSRSRTS